MNTFLIRGHKKTVVYWGMMVVLLIIFTQAEASDNGVTRKVICLDGDWQIAEGSMDIPPMEYTRRIPVPGLVDMAEPAFEQVGVKSDKREAFWYRREFVIDGPLLSGAMLRIRKAKYGLAVYLNGRHVADHMPCFTPAWIDICNDLHADGAKNELVIRLGANRESLPPEFPDGWDFEKMFYYPGIYDSVELVMTGDPFISDLQAAPDIKKQQVRIAYTIHNPNKLPKITIQMTIIDVRKNQPVRTESVTLENVGSQLLIPRDEWLSMDGCRLWTPEDPYLYAIEVKTAGDVVTERFGMRSFELDPATGWPKLNGKFYFMRGTNVCIYRFFEDAQRGNLPWNKEWVRKLHQQFKKMHWNSVRYCIGFPPDFWYDIADEEGILIQDEFPIWHINNHWPDALKADELAREYIDWMKNRWNHPCVVIWDAQNETLSGGQTDHAIQSVRELDLSNRPWDNGWDPPQAPSDSLESHPYFFIFFQPPFDEQKYVEFFSHSRRPDSNANYFHGTKNKKFHNPTIINEYGWIWLNRDGSPTQLSQAVYPELLKENNTLDKRRELYARLLAAKTEYWRSHRKCAGVMEFCGLGYSRPGDKPVPQSGATSDHWIDVKNLVYEPYFEKYVRDAFSPLGLMIDIWNWNYSAGESVEVPVVIINDGCENFKGPVTLILQKDDQTLWKQASNASVGSLGREVISFSIVIPVEPGSCRLIAELISPSGEKIQSIRCFDVSEKSDVK